MVSISKSPVSRTFKRYLFNVAHIKKFVQTLEVASTAKELLKVNKHLNLREVYYRVKRTLPGTNINIVDEQTETNKAIEDLELSTGVPREQLHINADKEGVAAGKVVILDKGDTINWSKLGSGGWSIPSNVEDIKFKKVNAKFIIYLEKMATWERLHEDKIWQKLNCIIIASRGQATRGIRRILQRLSTEHKLPIYVLVDGDPWGIYIYSVLKYGSISLAHMAETLVIPKAKYLGLSADDVIKYGLEKHLIRFKEVDKKRIKQMDVHGKLKNLGDLPIQNEILFVMDSVGFPEFKKAKTPNCNRVGKAIPAYSHSFYTVPSVHAMFHGAVPQPENECYWPYGRYSNLGEHNIVPDTTAHAAPVVRTEGPNVDQRGGVLENRI